MTNLESLKSEIEDAAFMLIDDASRKEIHAKLVNCLVILNQITGNKKQLDSTGSAFDKAEVAKVARRLRMWAKPERQGQYNSRILNAYLELRRSGHAKITEDDLSNKLGPSTWFLPNFTQMKAIADRNHGKVFDADGPFLTVWEPVKPLVTEYEKTVYGNEADIETGDS